VTATGLAGFSTATLELAVQHVHTAHAADNSAKSITPVDSCGCQLRVKLNAPPAPDSVPPSPACSCSSCTLEKNARGVGGRVLSLPCQPQQCG